MSVKKYVSKLRRATEVGREEGRNGRTTSSLSSSDGREAFAAAPGSPTGLTCMVTVQATGHLEDFFRLHCTYDSREEE